MDQGEDPMGASQGGGGEGEGRLCEVHGKGLGSEQEIGQ